MIERSKTAEDKLKRTATIIGSFIIGAIVVAAGMFAVFLYHAWRFFNGS